MVERGVAGLVLKNGEGWRLGDLELIGHGEGDAWNRRHLSEDEIELIIQGDNNIIITYIYIKGGLVLLSRLSMTELLTD